MTFRTSYVALAVVVAAAVGLLLLGSVAAYRDSQTSDCYKTVEADPSWLGYLPSDAPGIEVAGLSGDNATLAWARQVDLLVDTKKSITSLRFAASRQTLATACPGSSFLGRLERDFQLRFVSQIGADSTDWLKRFGNRTPSLDELDYLR